jgi:hypothetical protein
MDGSGARVREIIGEGERGARGNRVLVSVADREASGVFVKVRRGVREGGNVFVGGMGVGVKGTFVAVAVWVGVGKGQT